MTATRRHVLTGILSTALGGIVAQAAGRRWIDVHMHVIGGPAMQFGQAVEQSLAQMNQRGIAKAVIFPPPLPAPVFDHPSYVPELRRYPDRFGFLGGGGFLNSLLHKHSDPASVTPAVRQKFRDIAQRIVDAGAAGFGEIALLHFSLTRNHPFEQASPEHPLMIALVEIAARNRAVIDLHMDAIVASGETPTPSDFKVPPNPPRVVGNIAGFERLLAHDRNARIVWAHGGSDFTGHMTPALIGRLMDTHSNLYVSLRPFPAGVAMSRITGLQARNTIMPEKGIAAPWLALLNKHSDRFVMGADTFFTAPSVSPDNPTAILGRGNGPRLNAAVQLVSRLPEDIAQKVGSENAVRLYRL
jgi:hypothetical protein